MLVLWYDPREDARPGHHSSELTVAQLVKPSAIIHLIAPPHEAELPPNLIRRLKMIASNHPHCDTRLACPSNRRPSLWPHTVCHTNQPHKLQPLARWQLLQRINRRAKCRIRQGNYSIPLPRELLQSLERRALICVGKPGMANNRFWCTLHTQTILPSTNRLECATHRQLVLKGKECQTRSALRPRDALLVAIGGKGSIEWIIHLAPAIRQGATSQCPE